MLAYLKLHVGWKEILKRTVKDSLQDDAFGLAAQLAYYFFLALFPALLCLIALASLFPLEHLTDDVIRLLQPIAPSQVIELIRDQMLKISNNNDTALLSLGLLAALWSSSAAMGAILNAMNRAYDIEDSRSWWKVRITAVVLTVGLAMFILTALTLVLAGPELADFAARRLGLPMVWAWIWKVVQWPLVFALVSTGIGIIYYYAPDAEQQWVWITPGSIVAATLWLLGSLGFRYYIVNFTNYEEAYGTVGAIIFVMLWFYLTGLVIVIGAELNAEIEHASPWGKAPGEKVPGQRRRLGILAAREYEKRSKLRPVAVMLMMGLLSSAAVAEAQKIPGASATPPASRSTATFADAQRLFYNGKYVAAADLAETLLGGSPIDDLAVYELRTSALHFQIRRAVGASENKDNALRQCSACPAILAAFRKDISRGQALARTRLQAAPDDETALFFLGKINLNHVWLNVGTLGRRTGLSEFREARRSLDAVLQRNPNHVRAKVARAWIEYIVDTRVPWGFRWMLGGGDRKRALATVQTAATADSDFFTKTEATFSLWEMQVRELQLKEAAGTARGLVREFPENSDLTKFVEKHGG